MEAQAEPPDTTTCEEIDPLAVMAGVAAEADRAAKPKRVRAPDPGRGVCFVTGCDCKTGLKGVPAGRIEDAMHIMTHEMGIDLGEFKGKPRVIPPNSGHNKFCPEHYPELPEKQILGAKVLVKMNDGNFKPAIVSGPAPVAVGRVLSVELGPVGGDLGLGGGHPGAARDGQREERCEGFRFLARYEAVQLDQELARLAGRAMAHPHDRAVHQTWGGGWARASGSGGAWARKVGRVARSHTWCGMTL